MLRFDLRSLTGFVVRFESEDIFEEIESYKYLAEAMIPGATLTKACEGLLNIKVTYKKSTVRDLVIGPGHITIQDDWGDKISLDLWHMMYSLVRDDLINNKRYSVHAACAGRDEEHNILLVGHTGCGKTTVMLKLVNDLGYKIFSGNRTIIQLGDKLTGVGGTKTITIRERDLEKYKNLKTAPKNYQDRSALNFDENHFFKNGNVIIPVICIIKVEPGADRMVELSHPSSLHALFPFFLDTVYADTLMCNGEKIYASNVSLDSKISLSQELIKSLSKIKVVSMAGSSDYLTREIDKLL